MATIEDKAEAVLEWAKGWPDLDGYLKLNALVTEDGEASLNIVPNDAVKLRYIDGTAVREYTIQLRIVTQWSSGYDPVTVEAERLASSWLDWVGEQYPDNIPNWDGCSIIAIEPMENAPLLATIYEDDGLADYSIQAKITYEE